MDARGWTFLHFAMVSLHEKEVIVLLQNPLVRSLISEKDAKGNTPLYVLAASKRFVQLIDSSAEGENPSSKMCYERRKQESCNW